MTVLLESTESQNRLSAEIMSELYNKTKSLVKLKVYMKPDGKVQTFYSFLKNDKKGWQHSMFAMEKRLLLRILRGKYITALFFDNHQNKLVGKWVNGKKEF